MREDEVVLREAAAKLHVGEEIQLEDHRAMHREGWVLPLCVEGSPVFEDEERLEAWAYREAEPRRDDACVHRPANFLPIVERIAI